MCVCVCVCVYVVCDVLCVIDGNGVQKGIYNFILQLIIIIHRTSHITYHTSHITHHTSHTHTYTPILRGDLKLGSTGVINADAEIS